MASLALVDMLSVETLKKTRQSPIKYGRCPDKAVSPIVSSRKRVANDQEAIPYEKRYSGGSDRRTRASSQYDRISSEIIVHHHELAAAQFPPSTRHHYCFHSRLPCDFADSY